jgi:phage replication O-like protein O
MPKGDRLRLKADPEDGTTPIANLLLEAVAMARLSGLQTRAILHLWRRTYGWVGEDGKRIKEAKIALTEWARALDSSNTRLSHSLSELEAHHIIKRRMADSWGGYYYSLNTNISQWDNNCINLSKLAEGVGVADFATVDKNATIVQTATVDNNATIDQNDNSCPKRNGTVDQNAMEQLTKTQLPTLYKESINKDKEKGDLKIPPVLSEEKLKRGKLVADVFTRIDKIRGYRPPKRGAENKSVLRMIKDYTSDQIIETYQKMKTDVFWENKELYLMSVESQIGAIIHGKSGGNNGRTKGDQRRSIPGNRPAGAFDDLAQRDKDL